MNDQTDAQLLRAYVEYRSEPAFAELVRRHVDFVHSAALRMVCDSHLAQDVTQGVFIALAKSAVQLMERPVLSGWLHRTAQNIAAQTIRTDVRRRAREQEAATMTELLSAEPDASWEHIAPHLDDALGELAEPDRDALLLRYFERKSALEMAQVLGISDEAAQKRVSRAVERLREFFAKRGITVGASGLAVVISANAVQAAPVGLALTISTAAVLTGTTLATTATVTATKAIAMTALQKTIVTATVAVLAGAGIYEAVQNFQLREQVQALQQQQTPLAEEIEQLRTERDEAARQLATLRENNERLNRNTGELLTLRAEVARLRNLAAANQQPPSSVESAVRIWLDNLERVKAKFEEMPEMKIPELQFLSDYNWLQRSRRAQGELESFGKKAWRSLMAELRLDAKINFAHHLGNALDEFIADNDGKLPAELAQLNKYYDPNAGFPRTMEAAILERYQLVQSGNLRNITDVNTPIIVERASPVDDNYDTSFKLSVVGYSYKGVGAWETNRSGSSVFNGFKKVIKFRNQ